MVLGGIGEKVEIVFSVGWVDEALVGKLDAVIESIKIIDAADAHAEESEEVGGFGPEIFGTLQSGKEEAVGFDDVFANLIIGKGGGHGGEIIETVETLTDGGLLALEEFVVIALFELILRFVVKTGK